MLKIYGLFIKGILANGSTTRSRRRLKTFADAHYFNSRRNLISHGSCNILHAFTKGFENSFSLCSICSIYKVENAVV